jgi:hypothetical protein
VPSASADIKPQDVTLLRVLLIWGVLPKPLGARNDHADEIATRVRVGLEIMYVRQKTRQDEPSSIPNCLSAPR